MARPAPQNETPEERLRRRLEAPEREIRDNQAFLAALRETVKADRLRSAREEGQRLLDEGAK